MSRKSTRKRPKKKSDENFLDWDELDRLCSDANLFVEEESIGEQLTATTTTSPAAATPELPSKERSAGIHDAFYCPEPECGKSFKTISGFKSHMSQVQKTTEKQAFTHQGDRSGRTGHLSSLRRMWDETTFNQKKLKCIEKAFTAICTDELLSIGEGDGENVQKMASAVQHLPEKLVPVADLMYAVIDHLGTSGNYTLDTELMFKKFHSLALNTKVEVIDSLQFLFPGCSQEIFGFFVQVFLRELRDSVFPAVVSESQQTVEVTEATVGLTESDQNVLCYIAGYILYALKKRYQRFSGGDFETLLKVLSDIRRRLLVRELENVIRVEHSCSSSGVAGVQLKETLLTSFMVMHNWAQLIPEQTSMSTQLLEHCIELYTKVRGFAFAKLQRRKIALQANKALRKVLEDKGNLKY